LSTFSLTSLARGARTHALCDARRATPRRRALAWLLLLGLCCTLVACGRGSSDIPNHIFAYALGSDPETFDPGRMSGSVEGRIAYDLFEGLISPGPGDSDVRPGVAERWEMSEDGFTYRFFLRNDARWSNGDPVTAHDFAYAWLRILRGDVAANYVTFVRYFENARAYELTARKLRHPLVSSRLIRALEPAVGIEVVNDYELVVTLQNVTPYFLDVAMFYTLFPVHRGSIETHGQEGAFRAANIVTNGPYRMHSFQRRNRIILKQNEHYWDRASLAIEEVHALIIEDNSARVTAYLDGRVDWSNDPPHNQLATLAAVPGFQSAPMFGTYYFRFNVTRPPLDDVRVRTALTLAVNREELCRCTLDDMVDAALSFVPPTPGYTRQEMVEFDPARARALLAEAGYPNGQGFPTMELLYNTSENHRVIAQALQDMWSVELGINVRLLNQEWQVYLDAMDKLEYDVARAGWIGDYVDPNTFLSLWRSFDENNNTGWENERYDALMQRSMGETDPARREQILIEAEQLLLTELPVMPIYFYSQFHLVSPRIRGWEMNVRDTHLTRYISKVD